jgi:hypothetical protein
MKRFLIAAAIVGLASVPALANAPPRDAPQQGPAATEQKPVALSDQELDAVSGGDLLGLNVNLTALNALNANLQASLGGLNAGGLLGTPGLLGNGTGLLGNGSPLAGLLNTTTGLLHNLGL